MIPRSTGEPNRRPPQPRARPPTSDSPRTYSLGVSVFEPIFEALERGDVRYVTVGGVAVVLQGYARLTADVDLVVDLSPEEARRAIEALTNIGLRPAAPVDALDFADPVKREEWIARRHMQVFSLRDPDEPLRQVDLFVEDPVPFQELWERSVVVPLGSTTARVASIDDLIRIKRDAGGRVTSRTSALSRRSAAAESRAMAERPGEATEWPVTWEAHRRDQILAVARVAPAARLAWLEEALLLALGAGAVSWPGGSAVLKPVGHPAAPSPGSCVRRHPRD